MFSPFRSSWCLGLLVLMIRSASWVQGYGKGGSLALGAPFKLFFSQFTVSNGASGIPN
jgi:hypothetical protein